MAFWVKRGDFAKIIGDFKEVDLQVGMDVMQFY